MIVNYKIHEVSEYINWIYFFHAWGFQPKFAAIADIHGCDSCRAMWLTGFAEEDRPKASEAMQLFKEANRMLNELDTAYQTHGVVNIMDANADGDDLLLNSKRFPLLRQQTAKLKEDDPFLCLSDFVDDEGQVLALLLALGLAQVHKHGDKGGLSIGGQQRQHLILDGLHAPAHLVPQAVLHQLGDLLLAGIDSQGHHLLLHDLADLLPAHVHKGKESVGRDGSTARWFCFL